MPDPARDGAPWTIARVLAWATDDFRARGLDSPRLDAEVLLAHVLGVDRIRLIVDAQRPLAPEELASYRSAITRRRRAEPVAYIVGQREFHGHRFRVDPRVLVPRPDTETLVEVALDRTRYASMYGRALDLCTGSGNVAISFAKERPTWAVTAVDLSADATALARENALRLGAAWSTTFLTGDLFEPLAAGATFDVVTANPPYVPSADHPGLPADVREHEPRLALDGGDDGLAVLRRIVEGSTRHLAPNAVLAVEVMAGQAPSVVELFRSASFGDIRVHTDYAGIERVVSGAFADIAPGT